MFNSGTTGVAILLLWVLALLQEQQVAGEYEGGKPHDSVVNLKMDTFQPALDDTANSVWLLKFYAPWCGHCKRLAPVLDEVAPLISGKMSIGKIDCTTEKKLCDKHSVRGYPTLKLALDGEISDYPGLRTKDDIMKLAEKMAAPPIALVSSYDEALELAKNADSGVAFVGYHPDTNGKETLEEMVQSHVMTRVLGQVSRKLKAQATFALLAPGSELGAFAAPENNDAEGFIIRVEDNVQPRRWKTTTSEEITSSTLEAFVKDQNIGLVTELGPPNFHKVGRNGRPLVLGVVDADDEEQREKIKSDLEKYAKTADQAITDQYYFCWIDGKKWQKFLKQFEVAPKQFPLVFILDVPSKTYWKNKSYASLDDFIAAVQEGVVEPKTKTLAGAKGLYAKFKYVMIKYRPWSVMVLVLLAMGVIALFLPLPRNDLRPPYDSPEGPSAGATATATSSDKTTTTTTDAKSEEKEEEPKKEK